MSNFVESHTSEVSLRDGATITVRPIAENDGEALREAFLSLSETTRYMRFLRSMDRLTESETRYLTQIDYVDHFAWVALADGVGIGVARYIRDLEDRETAEAAIVVADAWQRRGVATILLSLLGESAWGQGIRHLSALVSAENTVVIESLQGLGAELTPDDSTLAMRIDLPLPAEPVGDSSLMQALRAAARGEPA